MFGLRNKNGSCWINAALQSIFRIPQVQQTFSDNDEDTKNPVESAVAEVWGSRGEEGLEQLYSLVRVSPTMPAGQSIGDSHELLEFLCDKIPFLDKLVRFKVANVLACTHCPYRDVRYDSMTEFSIVSSPTIRGVHDAIADSCRTDHIEDWTCETCKETGCTKTLRMCEFPEVLVFHRISFNREPIQYGMGLSVNQGTHKYTLSAVVCFTGGHWLTWGRGVSPSTDWMRFDDETVSRSDPPNDFRVRLLMYSRVNT